MKIVESYKPGVNFWDQHPDFLATQPFLNLWKEDKSKGKTNSSTSMWFVVFCFDMDSKYYNLEFEERCSILGEDYCGDANYYQHHKDTVDKLQLAYCKLVDSKAKRSLRNWFDKLEERDLFISKTPFSMDFYGEDGRPRKGTADQLDKMMANTKKLWDDYQRIMEDVGKEDSHSEGRGGAMPSASDEGDL